MGTATSTVTTKQFSMPYRKGKNSKSKAKTTCKCLRCEKPTQEKYEGKIILTCGDEACYLNCDTCTERPTSECHFKPGIREGVSA